MIDFPEKQGEPLWPQSIEWVCTYPNTLLDAEKAKNDIMQSFPDAIFGEGKMLFAIALCLEEALVNAVRHGNVLLRDGDKVKNASDGKDAPDPARKFRVVLSINAARIRVEVENECVLPFAPEEVPDPTQQELLEVPNGRGVDLMRKLSGRVRWSGHPFNNRISLEWSPAWEGFLDEAPQEPFVEDGPWLLDRIQERDLTRAEEDVRVSLSSSLNTSGVAGNLSESQ